MHVHIHHCAQLQYTTQHKTVLIIFHHILQADIIACMYVCILRAGVQPTVDPYAEALADIIAQMLSTGGGRR